MGRRRQVRDSRLSRVPDTHAIAPEGGILRPRLYARSRLGAGGEKLVAREVGEDLLAALCIDLPSEIVSLSPAADGLPGGRARLWAQALAQIDDGLPVEVTRLDAGVRMLTGESRFVASRLLDLDRFTGPLPPDGALVAVPHRQCLLIHSIVDEHAIVAPRAMAPHVLRLLTGSGALTDHLYWWRRDRPLTLLPSRISRDAVTFSPPEEFVEALNALTE